MNKKTYDFAGKLILNDDADYEYILKDGNNEQNISRKLKQILSLNNAIVHITALINGRSAFNEDGYLQYKKDSDGIWSYFINGANIEEFLFNHTNEHMSINIKVTNRLGG